MLGGLVKELADPKNSRFQTQVAVLLLAFEAMLLAVIIARVPCTSLYLALDHPSPTLLTPSPSPMTCL